MYLFWMSHDRIRMTCEDGRNELQAKVPHQSCSLNVFWFLAFRQEAYVIQYLMRASAITSLDYE